MTEIRCKIECRQDDSRQSPGRLVGVLLEYETRALDRPETFLNGSLSWPEDGIILNLQHNRQAPLTRFIPKVEGRSVLIDTPLPDTSAGRDAATLIRNGTLRGLSVEIQSLQSSFVGGVREIRRARLRGAGLVDDGSYGTSTVEVRERGQRRRLWL